MYDLQTDPHELNNIYNDPRYASERAELAAELDRLRHKYKDTDEKRFLPPPGVRRNR